MRGARLRQKQRQLLECHHSLGPAASDKTRRNAHPIRKRQISNRERIKQAGHGQRSVIVLSCQLPAVPACHVLVSTKTEARAKAGYFSVIRMRGVSKVQFIRTVVAAPIAVE